MMMESLVILGMYFMIYSLIGWCWETPFASIVEEKKFVNRGFLHGPFIPIYAFGMGFIVLLVGAIEPFMPDNKIVFYILTWFLTAVLCSLLEYVVSYVLELMFDTRWWDYSDKRIHINGRVCLIYSIGWGVGGCVVYSIVYPNVTKLIFSINEQTRVNIVVAFATYFLIDLGLTLRELITLRKLIGELSKITNELAGKVVYNIDFFKDGINNTFDKISESIEIGQEKLIESVEKTQSRFKSEFIYMKGKKGIKLSPKQKELVRTFNIRLENSKALARFYRIYPHASSKNFSGVVEIIRNRFKRKDT